MSDKWNRSVECCGNCAFWPLGYQSGSDHLGSEPYGIGGHHTDGSVSECRRHAPISANHEMRLSGSAIWPTTKKRDYCGDFELRG